MNTSPGDEPATHADLLILHVWIGAVAKSLVQTGVLQKSTLIGNLAQLRGKDKRLDDEIEHMTKVINTW